MSDVRIDSLDERITFLAEKVEREGLQVPYEVIEYISERAFTHQALKGSLLHLYALSRRANEPITLPFARRMIEGIEAEEVRDPAEDDAAPEDEPLVATDGPEVGEGQPVADAAAGTHVLPVGVRAAATQDAGAVQGVLAMEPEPDGEAESEPEAAREPQPATEPQREAATEPEPEPEPETLFSDIVHEATEPAAEAEPAEPATVWFAPMRTTKKESLVKRAGRLLQRAGLGDAIAEGDLVAIKLHFGEEGNTGFVSPVFLREVVRLVKEAGGRPFLTDSNTLYRGKRFNAVDHIACAIHNGFSYATVDAPIIIADGLDGRDAVDVEIASGKHFESVRIGAAAAHADAMIVVSHVKGHEAVGFGGALKNVGMGLGSRSAKQRMHSDFEPHPSAEKCNACGRCVQWCPVNAITIGPDRVAEVDYELCYGCGECVAACPYGSIAISWKTTPEAIQEKIVEHVAGAVAGKEGKVVYLSFVTDVSPDCDCWNFSDASIVPDIGVLAAADPVAIDQAAYDLVREAVGQSGSLGEGMDAGADKFTKITGIDGTIVMQYGEQMGLGTREYNLRTIS